jgi:hypothetical protein
MQAPGIKPYGTSSLKCLLRYPVLFCLSNVPGCLRHLFSFSYAHPADVLWSEVCRTKVVLSVPVFSLRQQQQQQS